MKYLLIFVSIVFFAVLFAPDSASAACAGVAASGTYTVSASCTFGEAVHGVEEGNLVINNGQTLTIGTNETVVWNSGFSVTVDGSIMKSASGATLKKTNVWM